MLTGDAYSSGHLVLSLWDLHMFYLLRPILFRTCRYFTGLCSSNIPRYFLDFASHIDTSMIYCLLITHTLRIKYVRCIPLSLRSQRRATLLLPAWIYSCQSVGTVNFTLTSLYDKRDDLNFNFTNFSFLRGNIISSPAYGIFSAQLIRYVRACSSNACCILRAMRLSNQLLRQGYVKERLRSSLRKFYGRYGDLIKQYEVPSPDIFTTSRLCV